VIARAEPYSVATLVHNQYVGMSALRKVIYSALLVVLHACHMPYACGACTRRTHQCGCENKNQDLHIVKNRIINYSIHTQQLLLVLASALSVAFSDITASLTI
jgi:hypothetical protein